MSFKARKQAVSRESYEQWPQYDKWGHNETCFILSKGAKTGIKFYCIKSIRPMWHQYITIITPAESKMSESFVPTIDFTKHEQKVAEELYAALSTVGFACFTGTGLCQKVGYDKACSCMWRHSMRFSDNCSRRNFVWDTHMAMVFISQILLCPAYLFYFLDFVFSCHLTLIQSNLK